jgi:hypothetical protein
MEQMPELKKYTFYEKSKENAAFIKKANGYCRKNEMNRLLKQELMNVFLRFGYLVKEKDYEVTFRTTSGNVAWISINSLETIK